MVKTVPAEVLEVKTRGPAGQATAIFSRFNVVDLDGDITVPGAIPDGTRAVVSPYNHSSVVAGHLPAGRATIRTDHEKAVAEVEFFMTTEQGRNAFETVRELGELGEWSYAFKILDDDFGPGPDGGRVHYLKSLDVFEVSPVLRGAGIRTATTETRITQELRNIRQRFISGAQTDEAGQTDEATAAAMTEFLRFQRNLATI
jgi:Caudovirus prohead serine protease